MTAQEIQDVLLGKQIYQNIYIPEYTFDNMRIDGIMIDLPHRWVRGFEIKVSRADFNKDIKWVNYSEFCSSLCIVCPKGLIQPEEIEKPFGLMWIEKGGGTYIKRPKNFQKRNSLSWLYTYISVIEKEFPRICYEFQMEKLKPKEV